MHIGVVMQVKFFVSADPLRLREHNGQGCGCSGGLLRVAHQSMDFFSWLMVWFMVGGSGGGR